MIDNKNKEGVFNVNGDSSSSDASYTINENTHFVGGVDPIYNRQPIYGGDQVHGTNVKIEGGASPFIYPKYTGYYSIGDKALCIHFKTKPHFIHRLFTKVLLGWKWYDTN